MITTVVSAIFVAGGAEYMIGQLSSGVQANPLAEALTTIPNSKAGVQLEHQRQHMILMATATKSFKLVGKPKVATKPAPPATGGGGGGGAPVVNAPIPSPGTAQSIAYNLLPSFGFNAKQQFGCLNDIWTRESGWRVTAANASGAYGIPQALPGSKMASAGPNWQTNRPRRSSGALATSRIATARRAMPGRSGKGTAGTNERLLFGVPACGSSYL